eukprot:GEMP01059780.1.p1 GENE.GEMP01059780.1~~GEMP01059780.1.p1  ORF type:complete len:309 (+),score=85.84 GEMP01059780.1:201-1127(+)
MAEEALGRESPDLPDLPATMERLKDLHAAHTEIEAEYRRKLCELQREYRAKYAPLYAQRYDVLREESIPGFWLTAIQRHPMLKDMIEEVDIPVLEYLEDIRCEYKTPDGSVDFSPSGFSLHFVFAENPYFGPPLELVKTYHMEDSADSTEPVLSSIDTTPIPWKSGKDTTKKQVTRKQKNKRTKQIRKLTETVSVPSFFNFFAKHELPTEEELDTMGEERVEELECIIESDYEAGCVFRDKIIPHAVDWYTGDAVDSDMDLGADISEDDKDESDADSDESDEDTDGDTKAKTKKKRGKREEHANCKQQ